MPAPAKRHLAAVLRDAEVLGIRPEQMGSRPGLLVTLGAAGRTFRLEIDGIFAHLRGADRVDYVCLRCKLGPNAEDRDAMVARVRRGMAATLRNRPMRLRRGRPAGLAALLARAGAATVAFPEGLFIQAATPLADAMCGTSGGPSFSERAIAAFAPLLRWYAPTGWTTGRDGTDRLVCERQRILAERDASAHGRLAAAGDLRAILRTPEIWRGTRWERPEHWAHEIGAADLIGF